MKEGAGLGQGSILKEMTMKRIGLVVVIVVVLGAGVWIFASRRGSNQTSSGTAAPGARMAAGQPNAAGGAGAFSQSREAHKYALMLMRMASNIGRLETESDAPLTSQQAKSILAVLTPLRQRPSLSEDEAKDAVKGLKSVLTAKQLTELGKMKQPARRLQTGQRPEGAGQNRRFDPNAMKDFNPLNPRGSNPMAARSAKRIEALFDGLKKKAESK